MAAAKVGATIAPTAPENTTSYVVTQSEEEPAFFLAHDVHDRGGDEAACGAREVAQPRVRPFLTPSIGALKNLGSWLKVEMCWPDPHRLKLD
eukprot:2807904-Prymnesium_polylepis.1